MTQGHQVSADIPDWSREAVGRFELNAGRKLLRAVRDWERWSKRRGPLARVICWLIRKRHRVWTLLSGAEIPLGTRIGGGLLLPHPNGIVIHPQSVIGPNCLIFQQVTIGTRDSPPPVIGGHVDIGAGARVLGPVTIGNHARIGANAVVVHDVASNSTVVGIPARPVRTDPR